MKQWLTIVGCGDGGIAKLPERSRRCVENADLIYGSERLLVDPLLTGKTCIAWRSPMSETIVDLLSRRGRPVCVLATGDPMHYGIGSTLSRCVAEGEMRVFPWLSGFSMAASRLCWTLQEVECVSLCGHDIVLLDRFIAPRVRMLVLIEGRKTVVGMAERLRHRGFGRSEMVILSHMEGEREAIVRMRAEDEIPQGVKDFSIVGVQCVAGADAVMFPRSGGLEDQCFVHDGQLTKREVRAVTVSSLRPFRGGMLWDVGAGCGSIGIEWMRSAPEARAVAIERDDSRARMVRENALALGVGDLRVHQGEASRILPFLEGVPDAVFLGGSLGDENLFGEIWERLAGHGVLVANAVTIEGQECLLGRWRIHGGDLVRIDVSGLGDVGSHQVLKPRLSVLQWRIHKTAR